MLEVMLRDLLEKLLGSDIKTATMVMSSLGMKQVIDLLSGLGSVKLSETNNKSLTTLLERLSKLNTKRNTLVHGNWVLEGIVYVKNGVACLKTQFLRELLPADPKLAKEASNPINQKERVRYCFTLKRIEGVIIDVISLKTDFVDFTQSAQLFADAPTPQ